MAKTIAQPNMLARDWENAVHIRELFITIQSQLFSTLWNSRQARLLYCACARRAWWVLDEAPPLIRDLSREGICAGENYANGKMGYPELKVMYDRLLVQLREGLPGMSQDQYYLRSGLHMAMVCCERSPTTGGYSNIHSVSLQTWHQQMKDCPQDSISPANYDAFNRRRKTEEQAHAVLFRDIVPNPHRYVLRLPHGWRKWENGLLHHLAKASWDARQLPLGEIPLDRMYILADALEDFGVSNIREGDRVFEHLRGPGPHVWGCWALDLFMPGK